jgi:putative Holliday junction resolvase
VGIAVTDPLKMIAQPLITVENENIFSFLKNYTEKEKVDTIVIGLPRNMNNQDTDATKPVQEFEQKLAEMLPDIPRVLIDERLTSRMAKQVLIDSGRKKKDRRDKKLLDTVSAALILQSYLEQQR